MLSQIEHTAWHKIFTFLTASLLYELRRSSNELSQMHSESDHLKPFIDLTIYIYI